mmetsp:Transcript_19232/g.51044  ORF Transcript_19232/g.51044 Transcript_19232/m.51044 type:complete len:279 (+) Transcript_19232:724-1560(+)
MIFTVLHVFIVAEDHLLLTLVSLAPEVAPIARDQCPRALLCHEIDDLHCAHSHIVFALAPALLEGTAPELEVAIVGVCRNRTGAPRLAEPLSKASKYTPGVDTIDLYVSHLPQLDHDVRSDQIQRMRSLKLDLLLAELALSPQVPTIAKLQAPTALVSHEVDNHHGQLSHVVLALGASPLVDAVASHSSVRHVCPASIVLVGHLLPLLCRHQPQSRIGATSVVLRIRLENALHIHGTEILLEPVVEALIDASEIFSAYLDKAKVPELDQQMRHACLSI